MSRFSMQRPGLRRGLLASAMIGAVALMGSGCTPDDTHSIEIKGEKGIVSDPFAGQAEAKPEVAKPGAPALKSIKDRTKGQ